MLRLALLVTACLVALPFAAQMVGNDDTTFVDGMLVTSADVTTCPYRLIQDIAVSATEDFGADSRAKIFEKLRKKAKKLHSDAVVRVVKGGRHMTAFAFSRREYTGRAIRYIDPSCAPQK